MQVDDIYIYIPYDKRECFVENYFKIIIRKLNEVEWKSVTDKHSITSKLWIWRFVRDSLNNLRVIYAEPFSLYVELYVVYPSQWWEGCLFAFSQRLEGSFRAIFLSSIKFWIELSLSVCPSEPLWNVCCKHSFGPWAMLCTLFNLNLVKIEKLRKSRAFDIQDLEIICKKYWLNSQYNKQLLGNGCSLLWIKNWNFFLITERLWPYYANYWIKLYNGFLGQVLDQYLPRKANILRKIFHCFYGSGLFSSLI